MKHNSIPTQSCVRCGYLMCECTDVWSGGTPREGDASICIACGALQIFDANLNLRNPTLEERLVWEKNQLVIDAQIARAHLIGDKLKME